MEITLRNYQDKYAKCVVFGTYDHANNRSKAFVPKEQRPVSFYEFRTDALVDIFFDGDGHRVDVLDRISKECMIIEEIEYSSDSEQDVGNMFQLMQTDANATMFIKYIFPFKDDNKKEKYPMIIKQKIILDMNTTFLFILKPKETITLKLTKYNYGI